MKLTLRPMLVRDLQQVMHVNQQCFTTPWSENIFRVELSENRQSHWVVLAQSKRSNPPPGFLQSLLRGLDRSSETIIGFGGFWLINGEAHISNIGVARSQRGKHYGELLLLTMLRHAVTLNAGWSSLEVRVSNTPAIQLYEKYGYRNHKRKVAYYHDNDEDAHWMVVKPLGTAYQTFLQQQASILSTIINWQDHFTNR